MKIKPKKVEMTRREVDALYHVLSILAQFNITTRMRYAVARCRQLVEPEWKAMEEALPRPGMQAYAQERQGIIEQGDGLDADAKAKALAEVDERHAELLEKFRQWQVKWAEFSQEQVTLEVYPIVLECEIEDTVFVTLPGVDRNRQHQAIIDALLPVLAEPE